VAAGKALKGRLFQADKCNDRRAAAYWLKFQYPSWWTSLLTALDTLYRLGFDRQDPDIRPSLAWFGSNQKADGLWDTGYGSGSRAEENRRWVGLAGCQALAGFGLAESARFPKS
jgi:hypothetical protein